MHKHQRKLSRACIQHRLLQIVRARAAGNQRERLRLELLVEGLELEQGAFAWSAVPALLNK